MEKKKVASAVHLRWTTIFCSAAIGFMCLGVLFFHYEAQRIQDDKYEDIYTIAKLKANSIQEWRRQRLADVRSVPGLLEKREITRLIQNSMNSSARAALQIRLNIIKKDTIYADALFLDTRGNILLSDNPNLAPIDQATMKAIEAALKDRREVLSDFSRDPNGLIYIDAVAPIPDNSGQPIAIVVLRSKAADFIYPLIQSWPTPSKTAETLLVCRDGDSVLFLNELRHRSNTALTLRFPLTDTNLPAAQAVLGNYGEFRGRDYRGIDVLAVTQPVPESPWSIVAKVDTKEILTEVKYRAWVITTITLLLILISAGLIRSVYRNRQDVERKLAEEALRDSEKRYRELSIVDDLTQLYNSRHFYFQLKIELDRSNRYELPLTLLLLDLDNFKAFNDTYGHVEGDQVLMRLGQVVKRCLRETDFAFRYGGEEFTILLPMTTSADGAVTAERIRTEFQKETFSPAPGQEVHVAVSIGLAQYKQQEEMKAFVHRVDQLMYQGKKNGKDRVCSEP